jgi:phage tail sheath protein FI
MGANPEQAFFVQCDSETNPPEVIDAGQVVTLIGIAPVKPAEFIVFRIGQHAGGTALEAA